MKRWLSLILAAALAVCVFAACSKDDNTSGSAGKHHVEIEVQDYGTIAVELDGDAAPITVDNLPPHHRRLHDPGRRPRGHRHGRLG